GAETHRFLAIRTQLVDDVTRGVDDPDVPLRIEAYGVSAARRAPGRSIDGRIVRFAGEPVRLGDRRAFPFAEHPIAPRPHELPAALEFDDRMRAAVQHENAAARCDHDGCRLDEVPRAGKTGGARGWRRPLHELVRGRRNFRSRAVTARRMTDRHRTDRDEPWTDKGEEARRASVWRSI